MIDDDSLNKLELSFKCAAKTPAKGQSVININKYTVDLNTKQ